MTSATATPSANGSPITATYVVQAPGNVAWSTADNGNYTIALNATVTDVAANHVAANPSLGTFSVNIAGPVVPPTAVLTPPATVTAFGQVVENDRGDLHRPHDAGEGFHHRDQ